MVLGVQYRHQVGTCVVDKVRGDVLEDLDFDVDELADFLRI